MFYSRFVFLFKICVLFQICVLFRSFVRIIKSEVNMEIKKRLINTRPILVSVKLGHRAEKITSFNLITSAYLTTSNEKR